VRRYQNWRSRSRSADLRRPQDFEVANIAREQLQIIVDKFKTESKPSTLQRMGLAGKSSKTKAVELLETSIEGEGYNEPLALVENLETEWKTNNGKVSLHPSIGVIADSFGQVYQAFKTICSTLDNHRSVLKLFPSQNNYASPLCGAVTILMKVSMLADSQQSNH
jgi:hypothetical protein